MSVNIFHSSSFTLLTIIVITLCNHCAFSAIETHSLRQKNNVGESKNKIWKTLDGLPPILLGHQGEKILYPAHTLPAYEASSILGADYVEPDLALTKDGVLICYHDVTLKGGTDIANHPELDYLKKNYSGIIGIVHEEIRNDWFIRDLTWAQIKTLKVTQKKVGVRLQYANDLGIPSFTDFLHVMHKMNFLLNKTVGIIPELKHPSFHNQVWPGEERKMERLFLRQLKEHGYAHSENEQENCKATVIGDDGKERQEVIKCPPVIIQNFDKSALQFIRTQTNMNIMMVTHPEIELLTYRGMDLISTFAQYFCVYKEYMNVGVENELRYTGKEYDEDVINSLGGFIEAHKFPEEAHKRGMRMALFTIPDSRENSKRSCAIVEGCEKNDKIAEMTYFFDLGLDAMFLENMAESREIRMNYERDHDN